MDTIKSLMDKREYKLVIKLTENSQGVNDLFYRVSAFVGDGQYEAALNCIQSHRKILEKRLSLLMKMHMSILCALGLFDVAYKELEYYKNLPYESQETEEMLAKIPDYIRAEERKMLQRQSQISDEELIKLLHAPDVQDTLGALDLIKERNIKNFLPALKSLMVEHKVQSVRSFALLVLVSGEINEVVKFSHKGEIIEVNPSELSAPFKGEDFNFFTKKLELSFKNPSLLETAMTIHATYIIYNYPVCEQQYSDEMIVALTEVANNYMKSEPDVDLKTRCEEFDVDLKEVQELIDEIEESCQNF